tara:strand:- start:2090 stop:2422 length:333 start_codon:yes stop_codon:yes gene_type:complete
MSKFNELFREKSNLYSTNPMTQKGLGSDTNAATQSDPNVSSDDSDMAPEIANQEPTETTPQEPTETMPVEGEITPPHVQEFLDKNPQIQEFFTLNPDSLMQFQKLFKPKV